MKAVLISIQPKWCEKICHEIGTDKNGKPIYEKQIEVRKTKPSIPTPFKVLIYCTKDKPYLYRVDDDDNFELTNTLRPKVDAYVKDYNEQNGKVIGEFVCDKIEVLFNTEGNLENYMTDILPNILQNTAMSFKEFQDYVGSRADKNSIYGWHISDLKIYDKPKELSEFVTARGKDYCDGCGVAWESCNGDYHCTQKHRDGYHLSRAPQSWMYIEE